MNNSSMSLLSKVKFRYNTPRKLGKRFLSLVLVMIVLMSISTTAFATGVDTWTTKASMETARSNHQVAVVNGKIYAIGGNIDNSTYLNSVEEYDPATNTWTAKASMADARAYFDLAVINGKIYAIGGNSGIGNYLNSVEEYDPATDTWTTKASMAYARSHHQVAVVNDKIYVIGGANSSNNPSFIEEYDPATDTWTTKASVTGRTSHQVAVVNDKIYIIGGTNQSHTYLNTVEEYNPATNTKSTKATMANARSNLQVAVVDGNIYAIGGFKSDGFPTAAEVYDPTLNTWTTKASMTNMRAYFDLAVINGKIYAIGGSVGGANGISSTEEYDPATNTWTTKASMANARLRHHVAVVDGNIFAIGGSNATTALSSTEKYTLVETTTPESPTTLTATAGDSQVLLSWSAVSDATSYNVYRSTTSGGPYTAIGSGVSETTYTDSSVTNGTNYYYVVTAVNSGEESAYSNEASATPTADPVITAPTNLTATAGNSQVALSWTAVSDATSYNVYRSTTSGGPYTAIGTGVSETTYTDSSAVNGTTYYYVITAVDNGVESAYSNEASATPSAPTTTTGRAILVIHLFEHQKEYDLTMDEVIAFISLYDAKASGSGKSYYIFNNSILAPFNSRQEYLVFDKIIYFEIKQYD